METQKLVSVIIPTFKRPDTLARSIESVLNQTYNNIEIIVVDDNNPESEGRKQTEEVMAKYQRNKKVLYIKHEKNKNGSAARNTGFRNSSGEYIMFLDDDDEFLPEKVQSQVEFMDKRDMSWGACYTSYIRKKDGKIVAYSAEKREGNLLAEELMRNLFIHAGSNLLVRRSVIDEIGGFDESFLRNQDIEFLTRILKKYKLGYVDKLGLVVNVHEKKSIPGFNFISLTEQYIKKFQPMINQLPEYEQKRIYKMINLQVFRYYIAKRELRLAINTVLENNIPFKDVFRYMFYLVKRFISKKAYGFDL